MSVEYCDRYRCNTITVCSNSAILVSLFITGRSLVSPRKSIKILKDMLSKTTFLRSYLSHKIVYFTTAIGQYKIQAHYVHFLL